VINVVTIFPPLDFVRIKVGAREHYWYAPEGYNPVLRPLSDLYRAITHNGEEIVPILEMAQLIYNDALSVRKPVKGTWRFENGHAVIRDNYDDPTMPGWRHEFYFLGGTFFLECFEHNISKSLDPKELDYDRGVIEQYKLFDYLHELKIDYRGLIDAGLAIDANTLEINPYK
jgi:hypothetical protein